MKRAKFVMKRTNDRKWHFVLYAPNGEPICQSETYNSPAACRKGIRSVRRNALIAGFEDRT